MISKNINFTFHASESLASNLDTISSVISATAGECEQSVDLSSTRFSSSASTAADLVDQLLKESVATLSRAKMPPVDLHVTSIAESQAKIAKHNKVVVVLSFDFQP